MVIGWAGHVASIRVAKEWKQKPGFRNLLWTGSLKDREGDRITLRWILGSQYVMIYQAFLSVVLNPRVLLLELFTFVYLVIVDFIINIGWMIVGSSLDRGWEFFSSPPRPDRLWGPPSFLSHGYREFFPWGGKRPERDDDHSPPSCAELENARSYNFTPP